MSKGTLTSSHSNLIIKHIVDSTIWTTISLLSVFMNFLSFSFTMALQQMPVHQSFPSMTNLRAALV